jgi:putative addiction module component (TIGR02574 family)
MENRKKLLEDLLKLTPLEKANIIDVLLKSLDEPDAALDELWAEEAESRIEAYEKGELGSISLEEFFNKRIN